MVKVLARAPSRLGLGQIAEAGDFENRDSDRSSGYSGQPPFRLSLGTGTRLGKARRELPHQRFGSRFPLVLFLVGCGAPDAELIELAEKEQLHRQEVLESQVWRMLEDARSQTLSSRFAARGYACKTSSRC